MKNIGIFILLIMLGVACSEDSKPEEPLTNEDLIVGLWKLESVTARTIVGPNVVDRDTTGGDVELEFIKDGKYLYSDITVDSISQVLIFKRDTLRYNFNAAEGDTMYFIKNTLAQDTVIIEKLTEEELSLVVSNKEVFNPVIAYKEQTIANFVKIYIKEEDDW